jgi:hypothetical protein
VPPKLAPILYIISLLPNLDNTFNGTISIIEVNVTKECKYIELHTLKLNVTSYVIKDSLKEMSCDGPPKYSAVLKNCLLQI